VLGDKERVERGILNWRVEDMTTVKVRKSPAKLIGLGLWLKW
jgi:hypothetical protein